MFLAEATYQDSSSLMPFHLSARQAGEIAQRAETRRLVLTHLTPDLDPVISLPLVSGGVCCAWSAGCRRTGTATRRA